MKLFIALFYLFFPCLVFSKSSEGIRRDHVIVSLISELDQVKPSENFYVGLKFIIEKDWHVYWKNPGDSGTSPRVKWQEGLNVGSIDWPYPKKILLDPLANYGYEGEVVLPMIVSVDHASGKNLNLSAQAEWLVCKVECIPGQAKLDLEIPLGDKNIEAKESSLIQEYLSKTPQKIHDIKSWYTHDSQAQVIQLGFKLNRSISAAYFFPYDGNQIQHALEQNFIKNEDGNFGLIINQSESLSSAIDNFSGVLKVTDGKKDSYFEIQPKRKMLMPQKKDFLGALLFAFLGGLILNLMPCVFPVISIKVLSLIDLTKDNPKAIRKHGWVYTLGVLLSFFVLSGLLLVLQSLGKNLGWGFQLQSPGFVLSMVFLFFFMALNLYGIFDIDGAFVNFGGSLANKKSLIGTLFTGVLAVIVATPCTAPFMGTALGITLTMPPALALIVYLSIGLGLAFPYLVLCYFPPLLRKLPKPGAWMKNLKQFLAFPMILTTIWLLWVLSFQTSSDAIAAILVCFVIILFIFWIKDVWKFSNAKVKRVTLVAMTLFAILYTFQYVMTQTPGVRVELGEWESYDSKKIQSYISNNQKVFIDFTAAWCLTCQVNKKLVLRTDKVLSYFNENNIKLVSADWTNQDPIITEALKKLGRNSVPVYVYYNEKGQQILLPEILSADIIFKSIK